MGNTGTNSDELMLREHFSRFFASRARLKAPLISALRRIREHNMSAFVFGGALRDLMVNGPSAEPRDVDVVVDCSSIDDLVGLFSDYVVRKTRFGGLHLNVRGWAVDIWPLSQTWALRESLVDARDFHALPKTTFLNVEAVTAEISPSHGGKRQLYEHGFFEAVQSRTLDINLEENPFPELCTVRSLITASSLRFNLSKRLARYILHYLHRTPFEELIAVQLNHYGFTRCDLDCLRLWDSSISSQIGTTERIAPLTLSPRQMLFWCNCVRSQELGCQSRCSESHERGPEFSFEQITCSSNHLT
ncbi:MAG: hypothetical protein JWM83_322 [Candidatus Angelobacter sp.]|nr:hypothetical protein [Candidatus Angelobacter sp.]